MWSVFLSNSVHGDQRKIQYDYGVITCVILGKLIFLAISVIICNMRDLL